MKFLTWNVNHRSRRKRVPPEMAEAISSLSPDVIVLTEYVPGPSHESFLGDLNLCGFPHHLMSAYTPKENHVLIAAHSEIIPGSIVGPPIAPSVPSNVLHVRHKSYGVDILGLRVPDYSKQPKVRSACWDWIESIADGHNGQPFVLLGDLNVDPSYPPSRCGDRLGKLIKLGWQHAMPPHGVSYMPINGSEGKRLDHAFISGPFVIQRVDYIWEANTYDFAGSKAKAMSDHAILVIEMEWKSHFLDS